MARKSEKKNEEVVKSTASVRPEGKSLFERMNLYGMNNMQEVILAALVTGEPLLMVGSAGAAKTNLFETLMRTLGLKSAVYNAACANYDDLVGYVLPNKSSFDSIDEVEMGIVKSPYGIFGKEAVLFDEVSRCRPDTQNTLLSVIRERRIQNVHLPELNFVFGAMNPIQQIEGDTYEGAEPLDKAFAERFALTVTFNHFKEMDVADRKAIISNSALGDNPAVKYWLDQPSEKVKKEVDPELANQLREIMVRSAELYLFIQENYGPKVEDYVNDFAHYMGEGKKGAKLISGRTAGMIYRNICAIAAVKKALNENAPVTLADAAYTAVFHSFPDIAYSDAVDAGRIQAAHKASEHHLSGVIEQQALAVIKKIADPVERVYAGLRSTVNSQDLSTLIIEALEELNDQNNPAKTYAFASALFYEVKDANIVSNEVLLQLVKEVKKIGLQVDKDKVQKIDTTVKKALDAQLNNEFKTLLANASSENEKTLLTYSSVIYSRIYSYTEDLVAQSITPFEDVHKMYKGMLTKFKGATENNKIKS